MKDLEVMNEYFSERVAKMMDGLALRYDDMNEVLSSAAAFLKSVGWKYKLMERTTEQERERVPKCPHCKLHPMPLSTRQLNMGQLVCVAFFCGSPTCSKLVSISVVGALNPNHGKGSGDSRLITL